MPTYVKSPTAESVEKTAESEVKKVGNEADDVVQDMVQSDGATTSSRESYVQLQGS